MKSRITVEPSFLDLVDLMAYGGTEDWRALYLRARRDPDLRRQIRDALPLIEPNLSSTQELWLRLIDRIEAEARNPRP